MSTESNLAGPKAGTSRYRGRTLEEILPQIRAELGPDAVILREREGLAGGVRGFFAQRFVEAEPPAHLGPAPAPQSPGEPGPLIPPSTGVQPDPPSAAAAPEPAPIPPPRPRRFETGIFLERLRGTAATVQADKVEPDSNPAVSGPPG
jgi:hypothetical protein